MGLPAAATAGLRNLASDRERPVLSCHGLRASVDGRVMVDGLRFDVCAGEAYGLIGPPGVGKTAVVLAVCGLLVPDAGVVLLDGQRADRLDPARHAALVGRVAQDAAILPPATVLDNLRIWARVLGHLPEVGAERIAEVVSIAGLDEHVGDAVERCSRGVRRALGLAVALLPAPRLLVVDEPTGGVDRAGAEALLDAVRRVRDGGTAVLYAGRAADEARSVCDRLGVLDGGHLAGERAA